MKDAGGNPILGKTRWRRFVLVFGLSISLVMGVLVGVAVGAITLPFTISGLSFTVAGDELHGTGFQQWGDVDACPALSATNPLSLLCTSDGEGGYYKGVAVTSIDSLTNASNNGILNLTQTVCGPTGLPGTAADYLKIVITGDSVEATNLIADVTDLTTVSGATATFGNLQVGIATPSRSGKTTFGQKADSFDISGGSGSPRFTQTAVYTQAGTFAVKHLALHATLGSSCS